VSSIESVSSEFSGGGGGMSSRVVNGGGPKMGVLVVDSGTVVLGCCQLPRGYE